MKFKHTFADCISFDDVVLAATIGTSKLTPEGVAMQYAIWDSDSVQDALKTVELLATSGSEFRKDYVITMVEQYYERRQQRTRL